MSVYILSTMTNSVCYRTYHFVGDAVSQVKNGPGPLPVPDPNPIMIHGGAGIPSLKSGIGEVSRDSEGKPLWTPRGVVTAIKDEDYERLKDHWLFQKHIKANYLKVIEKDISHDIKEIRRQVEMDMQLRDDFAQLSRETLKQKIKVKTPDKTLSQDLTGTDDESWQA